LDIWGNSQSIQARQSIASFDLMVNFALLWQDSLIQKANRKRSVCDQKEGIRMIGLIYQIFDAYLNQKTRLGVKGVIPWKNN